jgi:hypothetical protein
MVRLLGVKRSILSRRNFGVPASVYSHDSKEVFNEGSKNSSAEHPLAPPTGQEESTPAHFLITLLGDCAKRPADLDLGTLK